MPLSNLDSQTASELSRIIGFGGLSTFGGAAFFFYRVYKGQQFRASMFFLNLFLAFFVGYVVGKFFPTTLSSDIRDGMIAVSGFLSLPILELLEKKGLLFMLKRA